MGSSVKGNTVPVLAPADSMSAAAVEVVKLLRKAAHVLSPLQKILCHHSQSAAPTP